MINNFVAVGRLGRDADLRYTSNGTAVGTFSLAVDRPFKNQQGERETDWLNCVIWRKSAENFANFTRKGSMVGIEGRIQTRNYDDKDGKKVYITEIVVENFSLLDSKKDTQGGGNAPSQGNTRNNSQSRSQGGYQANNDPFQANGEVMDDSLDLPF